MPKENKLPTIIMISASKTSKADWQKSLYRLKRQSPAVEAGFLLRDYDHPQRIALAASIYKECCRLNIMFFLGGNTPFPHNPTINRHSPEGLVGLVGRYNRDNRHNMAAAHSRAAIYRAAQAGYGGVLISPVFATPQHPDTRPLGRLRFLALADYAARLGMKPYALGGMDRRQWQHLRDAIPSLGFAAVRHFHNK